MTPDDILFAPFSGWRQLCNEITRWIEQNRLPTRMRLALDRLRPPQALYLAEFAELYYEDGMDKFWRVEYPNMYPTEFAFDGTIKKVDLVNAITFPVYGEAGYQYYRSVEDSNLVINSYSHFYIFASCADAITGLAFLNHNYP